MKRNEEEERKGLAKCFFHVVGETYYSGATNVFEAKGRGLSVSNDDGRGENAKHHHHYTSRRLQVRYTRRYAR